MLGSIDEVFDGRERADVSRVASRIRDEVAEESFVLESSGCDH